MPRSNRCAFLLVTDWPIEELSDVGRLTASYTNEGDDHVGLFVPFCSAAETEAHSQRWAAEPSAIGATHVSFDYMADLLPRFQSIYNKKYYSPESKTKFYPIMNVDAADVHSICVDAARAQPRNYCCHRCNAVVWCWPFPCCCCPAQREVAQSTCVSLSSRVIAAAMTGMQRQALTSDTFVFQTLRIPRFSMATPRAPFFLSGYTPAGIAHALTATGVLGQPVDSVEDALSMCRLAKGAVTGTALVDWERCAPLLNLPIQR